MGKNRLLVSCFVWSSLDSVAGCTEPSASAIRAHSGGLFPPRWLLRKVRTVARNDVDLPALGGFIREQRTRVNLTQAQLAERVGWTQERISILLSDHTA